MHLCYRLVQRSWSSWYSFSSFCTWSIAIGLTKNALIQLLSCLKTPLYLWEIDIRLAEMKEALCISPSSNKSEKNYVKQVFKRLESDLSKWYFSKEVRVHRVRYHHEDKINFFSIKLDKQKYIFSDLFNNSVPI